MSVASPRGLLTQHQTRREVLERTAPIFIPERIETPPQHRHGRRTSYRCRFAAPPRTSGDASAVAASAPAAQDACVAACRALFRGVRGFGARGAAVRLLVERRFCRRPDASDAR